MPADPSHQRAIVITGLDVDGSAVLAVPLARAFDDVGAYNALAGATSFGDARAHPAAAALLDEWLDDYLERARDEHDDDTTGADDEAFDADSFFGPDNWFVWQADARTATMEFLQAHAEQLAAEVLDEDPMVRLNGPDNPPLVPRAARQRLEEGLRDLGFHVRTWEPLGAYYQGAPDAPGFA